MECPNDHGEHLDPAKTACFRLKILLKYDVPVRGCLFHKKPDEI